MAIKRTPDLIPHCHPVAIDGAQVDFQTTRAPDGSGIITAAVEVKSIARTGPEMEALTAVAVALTVAYDLLKPIDKDMLITDVHLKSKTGGKSDPRLRVREGMTAAVITCSDHVAAGKKSNEAAEAITARVSGLGVEVVESQAVALNRAAVQEILGGLVERGVDFIFTVGGVGLSGPEFLPELLWEVADREAPGIGERMRSAGADRTPLAMFTRPMAAVWRQTLIVALPGSSSGARESLDAVLPGLFQARRMLWKGSGSASRAEEGK